MAILYRHIRLDKNEPFYIGIGRDIKRASSKSGRNKWWKNIVSKTDYEVEIMLDDLTWEEACEKEKEFIKLYGRKDLGLGSLCNLTDGGEGHKGYAFSDEQKRKLSEANLGKRHSEESIKRAANSKRGQKHSEKTIEKMRERMKGNKYCTGVKLTEERKQKLINSNLGRKNTEETLLKMSQSKIGKLMNESIKIKISKTKTGTKLSEETKNKMSISQKNRETNTGNPKLIEEQVISIRKELHLSDKELSINYGVSVRTINRIRNGETWKHLLFVSQ